MNRPGSKTTNASSGRRRAVPRAGVVAVVRAVLFALLVAVPFAAVAARDTEPPEIEILRPLVSSSRSIIIRARVEDSSGIGDVTFWVKRGNTAYRAVAGQIGPDGSYGTRLMWFGGNKEVRYFVEATDQAGNGPARAGDEAEPSFAHFSHETFQHQKPISATTMALAVIVLVASMLCLLSVMLRRDRMDRLRHYWFRVLSPLVYLHGHDAIKEVDRLVSHAPEPVLPDKTESGRLHVLTWLSRLREFGSIRRSWPSAKDIRERTKGEQARADAHPAPVKKPRIAPSKGIPRKIA